MKKKSMGKYIFFGFITGFMLVSLGAIYEDFKHDIAVLQSLSAFHHFIVPIILGTISGVVGFLYWKGISSQTETINNYTKNLHSLLHINTTLLSTIDLKSVLQIITDESTKLTKLDTGSIYLHDNEKLYAGAATPPIPDDFPEIFRYDLLANHPNIQKSLHFGQCVVIENTELVDLSEAEKKIIKFRGLRSIIYIPLIIEKRPIGILILGTVHELRKFTKQEIEIYSIFSGQAALSIENANLYKKSLQTTHELRQQNEEFLTLNEELSESNKRIQKINDELKIAKEKAEEGEMNVRAIIENQPGLVWLKDTSGRFMGVNTKFAEACGLKNPNLLIGKTDIDIWPKELALKYIADDNLVIESGKPKIVEELIFDKGDNKWFETFKTPILNKEGTVIGTTGYSFEISIRKKAEEELIKAKEYAEETDQLKSAFLENISHEVRTPMNAILGFSELLMKPNLDDEKRKEFTKVLQNATHQLLTTIDHTITLAHIETKQLQLNKIDFNPLELLSGLYEDFNNKKQLIGKEHIQLILQKPEYSNIQIQNDYTRINEIFTILLDNAFKFTKKGWVEFGYTLETNGINFYVKDSGIGIPLDKQQTIFKSFAQADKSIRQVFGGLGVGLSIVLGLVNILDGEISINSEVNRGTEITFSLPFDTAIQEKETI